MSVYCHSAGVAAGVFKMTGAEFLGQVFMIMEADFAGTPSMGQAPLDKVR